MLRADPFSTALLVLGLLALAAWLHAWRGFNRSLAVLEPPPRGGSRSVSIIIAARNEEENLRRLLPRLLSVGEPLSEVIVVDDGSEDGTPGVVLEHAARDPRVRLIRAPPPPRGWAPKSHALWLGAQSAGGEALLFLDADVEPHEPRVLVEAAASAGPGELLAFAPRFACRTRRCRAAETAVAAVALGFYGYHRVVDPRDGLAWMYGCCWAVEAGTYRRLGGHAAVAGSIVEDRDFAAHAKRMGARIRFIDGFGKVSVWTYDDLAGFVMLSARLSLDPLRERGRAWAAAVLAASLLILHGPLVLAAASPPAAAALLVQLLLYARAAGLNGFSRLYALPALLAAAVLPAGLVQAAARGFTWRGRRYPPPGRRG